VRVLHVYPGKWRSGVDAILETLARRRDLVPEMESEFALCFDGALRRELASAGAPVRELGAVRAHMPWSVVRARRALRRLLAEKKYDVVVCHSSWSQAVFGGVPRTLGVPEVFYAHDLVRPQHWVGRWAARHAPDWSIANSEFTRAGLRGLFPSGRSSAVYCPLEPNRALLTADERRALRAEFGFQDDTVVIVQACAMRPSKGHDRLLRALARLPPPTSWFCLQIGEAERRDERAYRLKLEEHARALGVTARVRFLGERVDLRRLLAISDIHCQPNAEPEPFGVSFVDALEAGLPIVTFDMGGPREIVTPAVGLLVADEAELATALDKLVRDPELRRRLGENGPARARELCDPAIRMRELANVLERAAGLPANAARGANPARDAFGSAPV
jgi:glycosyltransferase involved in cell wall biosynthesis